MTFMSFLADRFDDADEIEDVATYGMAGGFSGFIYTYEIDALFDEYEAEILDFLEEVMGLKLSDIASDCEVMSDIKREAVWKVVEVWCCLDKEDRYDASDDAEIYPLAGAL